MSGGHQFSGSTATFSVRGYNLSATLSSGQAFRWRFVDNAWQGVIDSHSVRLHGNDFSITAQTATVPSNWDWLLHYLQVDIDFDSVLTTFPADPAMCRAVEFCRGLRLLRQDPWECLASFILSSTKQIVQIQQIVDLLCERFGEAIASFPGSGPIYSFPSAARIARATERELRDCKMGFRAPYLLKSAGMIAAGAFDLATVAQLPVDLARAELLKLPGVGRKIADCVLLFAYGFPTAFPLDVWVMKALQQLYFPKRRRVAPPKLHAFAAKHFGPWSGYAQQYLFHYMRTSGHQTVSKPRPHRRKK